MYCGGISTVRNTIVECSTREVRFAICQFLGEVVNGNTNDCMIFGECCPTGNGASRSCVFCPFAEATEANAIFSVIDSRCRYLADPVIASDGVTISVKCGCGKSELQEQFHPAHECNHPENTSHRCLPTLIPPDLAAWQARKPESDLYRLCHKCELRPKPPLNRQPLPQTNGITLRIENGHLRYANYNQ